MITPEELNVAIDHSYHVLGLLRVARQSVDQFADSDDRHQNQLLGAVAQTLSVAIDKSLDIVDALERVDCQGYTFGRSAPETGAVRHD